jgi:predicted nucleotidyltransferase
MINLLKIKEVKDRLVREFNPEKIYIFGSYAWGNPTEDSDLDIMIITKKCEDKIKAMRKGIKSLRGIGIPKDIIVEGENEFMENAKDSYRIENEVKSRGYLLYEKNH